MRCSRLLAQLVICLSAGIACADHHGAHYSRGPNGGALIGVGDGGMHVELILRDGSEVTARVLDKNTTPVASDAAAITLTFTEADGEVEDYELPAAKAGDGGDVFQRKSGHLVKHIIRDKMSIDVEIGGKQHASKMFFYPLGPNGGEVLRLGDSDLHAELVVDGKIVRIHVLGNRKQPTEVDAKEITLTFTEGDGEVEDYELPIKEGDFKGTVFERKSGHLVKHVKRDKIAVSLAAAGGTVTSKTFEYAK